MADSKVALLDVMMVDRWVWTRVELMVWWMVVHWVVLTDALMAVNLVPSKAGCSDVCSDASMVGSSASHWADLTVS